MQLGTLLCAAVSLGACSSSSSGSLHVTNQSSFAIVEFHVAPNGSQTWGPNLLASNPLNPGEDFAVDTSCGTYDVMLVDEQGVDCEIDGIDLCANNADFVIHNNTCAVFGGRVTTEGSGSSIPSRAVPR